MICVCTRPENIKGNLVPDRSYRAGWLPEWKNNINRTWKGGKRTCVMSTIIGHSSSISVERPFLPTKKRKRPKGANKRRHQTAAAVNGRKQRVKPWYKTYLYLYIYITDECLMPSSKLGDGRGTSCWWWTTFQRDFFGTLQKREKRRRGMMMMMMMTPSTPFRSQDERYTQRAREKDDSLSRSLGSIHDEK